MVSEGFLTEINLFDGSTRVGVTIITRRIVNQSDHSKWVNSLSTGALTTRITITVRSQQFPPRERLHFAVSYDSSE